MSKFASKEKPDNNQNKIVKDLRKIPGLIVYPGFKDLIIGYKKCTFWVEVKNPEKCLKDGSVPDYQFTKFEKKVNEEFTGFRIVAHSFNQIIQSMSDFYSMIGFLRIGENLLRYLKNEN